MRLINYTGIFRRPAILALSFLAALSISRLLLVGIYWDRVAPTDGLAAILVVAMVRSTLNHRPVNPSIAVFSQDSMVNQLPLNSPYSLLYAVYEHRRDARDKPLNLVIVLEESLGADTVGSLGGWDITPKPISLHSPA